MNHTPVGISSWSSLSYQPPPTHPELKWCHSFRALLRSWPGGQKFRTCNVSENGTHHEDFTPRNGTQAFRRGFTSNKANREMEWRRGNGSVKSQENAPQKMEQEWNRTQVTSPQLELPKNDTKPHEKEKTKVPGKWTIKTKWESS